MAYLGNDYFNSVKKLLKDSKLSVKDFLDALDINKTTYDSWLRYGNYPKADKAVEIAQYLGSTVEYMVTGKEPNDIPKDIMTQVIKLESLEPARRQPILSAISAQVDFWRGADAEEVPPLEPDITDEERDLLDKIAILDKNDKSAVIGLITTLSKRYLGADETEDGIQVD